MPKSTFSEKLKKLKDTAQQAIYHYTFEGYYIYEENMIEFLKSIVIILKDPYFYHKSAQGEEEFVSLDSINCSTYDLVKKIYKEPSSTLEMLISDDVDFYYDFGYYDVSRPNNLAEKLTYINDLIHRINEVLPMVIRYEETQREVDDFFNQHIKTPKESDDLNNIQKEDNEVDSEIWQIIRSRSKSLTSELYERKKKKLIQGPKIKYVKMTHDNFEER